MLVLDAICPRELLDDLVHVSQVTTAAHVNISASVTAKAALSLGDAGGVLNKNKSNCGNVAPAFEEFINPPTTCTNWPLYSPIPSSAIAYDVPVDDAKTSLVVYWVVLDGRINENDIPVRLDFGFTGFGII
jgi:hypothetical protein